MLGSQKPRLSIEPKRYGSDGADACILMSAYGHTLDEWQANVLNCWLGKDESGNYNVTSCGLSLPRQNGKNVCLEAREFFGLVIKGEKILHTAHQVRTAKKSFRRLASFFTDKRNEELQNIVKNIRYTNGEESIELTNGGIIEFSARSRQASRGFDGISLVVYDEAQELTDDQIEAITATLSASSTGTRQMIYTGTPPYPNCRGDVFKRRRDACINDHGEHDCWHEWSVEGKSIDDIDVDNVELWYSTNPSLGVRLDEDFTREELKTMSREGFARERLGWWSETVMNIDYVLDAKKWEECKSDKPKPNGKTGYCVDFSIDGAEVVLCGCVIREDGTARISEIERKPMTHGIRWLADWLNERYRLASCVVIDGKNGADLLIDRISEVWKNKQSIIRPRAQDVISSTSLLADAVNERKVDWYHLQEDLDDSAKNSVKRPIGGGFGFGGENASPIKACALAYWGVKNCKRDPTRKMKIG